MGIFEFAFSNSFAPHKRHAKSRMISTALGLAKLRAQCVELILPKAKAICSMHGIFTNIYPINHPNVGKYTIHGAFGKAR